MAETAYTLNITVRNKIATTTDPTTVVNGNNDYTVVFDFDSEWDSLSSKTAMFVYGREEQKYKTVTFTGNSCVMPALYNTGYVLIGVFAGNIKTTSAAYVKCIPCIKDNDSTLDTGGGGTIDTGTTDHSQLINRDIADQHPISAITGLEEALTPLVGTTQTITPSQVLAAIKAGRDIALQHTDSDYGSFVFSAFDASEQVGTVVSNSFLPHLDGAMFTLLGNADNESWFFDMTIPATKDDVGTAVNEALAQAKASGEFDGADGLTPTIGDNGNWYLGETDTGKPSRGEKGDKGDKGDTGATGATGAAGAAGKSAYAYAQDGGYTGTEEQFAAKLAKEKFANPYALTFTGAVTGSYDGSEPVTVEIPSGGGGSGGSTAEWQLLGTYTMLVSDRTLRINLSQFNGITHFRIIGKFPKCSNDCGDTCIYFGTTFNQTKQPLNGQNVYAFNLFAECELVDGQLYGFIGAIDGWNWRPVASVAMNSPRDSGKCTNFNIYYTKLVEDSTENTIQIWGY